MGRGGLPSPRRPSSERASGTGGPGGGRSPGERRWRRMVRKAEAYLSTASVYGGGNGDGGGNLPSLPVAVSSLSRKPGRRRGSPAGSSRARAQGLPRETPDGRTLTSGRLRRRRLPRARREAHVPPRGPVPPASLRPFLHTLQPEARPRSCVALRATPGFSLGTSLPGAMASARRAGKAFSRGP